MTIKPICLVASGLLLATPFRVYAGGAEVSPFYGYRFGGDFEDGQSGTTYSIQDGATYGLMIDLPLGNAGMRTELLWSRQDTSIDMKGAYGLGEIDLTVDAWEFGAIGEETKGQFIEYISAHVGVTHLSAADYGSDTRLNLSAAVGAKFSLGARVALRAELRAICTFVDADASFISIGGVTLLQFNGSTLWQGQATLGLSVMF